ncbi:MAG: hypothetical protein KI786_09135 [Mameliella sp.]|nr:hypothetical protein [Phaeodactylibacter sp.]
MNRKLVVSYAGICNVAPWLVIWPILMLSGFSDWVHAMDSNAWTGFLRGVLITGLSIFTTILFSRLGWRWKT